MAAALIYARQSDPSNKKKVVESDDDSLSCRAQIEECQRLADANNDKVIKAYSDQFTGFSAERPQWQALLTHVKDNHARHAKGHPDRITRLYIHNYKRLGRSDTGYGISVAMKSLGIEVVPVADKQFTDDMAGKIMEFLSYQFSGAQVTEALAQANATRRSITDAGQLICAGKALYGYTYDKKARQRVRNPTEAEVVLRIFESIASGSSIYRVCDELFEDEILTPRGQLLRWHGRTIVRLISNPSYKGAQMSGYKYSRDDDLGRYTNGRKKVKIVAGKPVGEPTPRIVEDALWEEANRQLDNAKRKPNKNFYWLKSRVRCGNCGRAVIRTWNKTQKRYQWMCSGYAHKRGCTNMYTHNKDIEPPAWERVLVWAKNANVVEEKLQELEAKLVDPSRAKLVKDNERQITNLKRQLADLAASLGNTRKAVREAITTQMDKLAQQVEAHESLREQYAEDTRRVDEAHRHCESLREHIRSRIDAGTATDEEKARLAEAIGLTVIVQRLPDQSRSVNFLAFDYHNKKQLYAHTGSSMLIGLPEPESYPVGQTKAGLFAGITVFL